MNTLAPQKIKSVGLLLLMVWLFYKAAGLLANNYSPLNWQFYYGVFFMALLLWLLVLVVRRMVKHKSVYWVK